MGRVREKEGKEIRRSDGDDDDDGLIWQCNY